MSKQKIGALQVALAAACWSFAGVFCKYLPWNPFTIIGLRAIVCTLALRLTRKSFRVKITRGTLLGAVGMAATGVLFLCATKLTTSANAIVLQYAMPVFVFGLCWLFYRQKPSKIDVLTSVCVLIGVALCSLSGILGGGGKLTGDLLALVSAVTYSLVFFCARLPDTDAADYVYLGALISTPLALNAFFDPDMTLRLPHILAILAMGLCLAGGYFFISKSLNNVEPVTSALLANLEPVLNPIWVYLFLGENPGIFTVVGALIVIGSITVYSILGLERK